MPTQLPFLKILKKPIKKFFSAELNLVLNYLQQIENSQALLKQTVEERLQKVENIHSIQLMEHRLKLLRAFGHIDIGAKSDYKVASPKPYESYLADLEALSPDIFPIWKQCFDTGTISYKEEREHSCSTPSNAYAVAFQSFVALHAKGRVLDQGCGIYGLPTYLEGYPAHLVSAIEPLEPVVECNFEIVRGFNEFLPWPDQSFSTIVNATSLDHVLCLDTAIAETHRVLHQDGCFIVWLASIKNAKPFDPTRKPPTPIDKFHLFHFEDKWFEALMQPKFSIAEKLSFPTPSFDHIFYAFKKESAYPTTTS